MLPRINTYKEGAFSDMKVTYITPDNSDYFEGLASRETLEDERLVCLGAIAKDGTACAVLATGIYEETAYIEWIYTDPSYRRERAARTLFEMLRTLLRKIEVKAILVNFPGDSENLEEFLMAEGFFVDEDMESYSIPVIDLVYSEMIDRLEGGNNSSDSRVVTLSELGNLNGFHDFLRKNSVSLLSSEEDFLSQSLVRIGRDGKINGCMLIIRQPDGDITIPYLISSGYTDTAVDLFLAFKRLVTENEWLGDNIVFSDTSGEITGFLEEVLGEDCSSYVISGQKQGIRIL